ncbi:MAG: ParB/RepB/Spo0J family partition protein [Thermodesulfobacteriota bacterium]
MGNDRLGKGLEALLPDHYDLNEERDRDGDQEVYFFCKLDDIDTNPYQPRSRMSEEDLKELSQSIERNGILQPLVISRTDKGYEVIVGERRLRAAKMAGLDRVPVVVKEVSPQNQLELALIENIQRQNLNPVEEAEAYNRLIKEFSLTQEEVSAKVGKKRSTVTNMLRLIQLPDYIKEDLLEGRLNAGHARVLAGLLNDLDLLKEFRDKIIQKKMSVRQAEKLVQQREKKKNKGIEEKKSSSTDFKRISKSYCESLTRDITRFVGNRSRIVQQGSRGKLEIEYHSLEDLERIYKMLSRLEDSSR